MTSCRVTHKQNRINQIELVTSWIYSTKHPMRAVLIGTETLYTSIKWYWENKLNYYHVLWHKKSYVTSEACARCVEREQLMGNGSHLCNLNFLFRLFDKLVSWHEWCMLPAAAWRTMSGTHKPLPSLSLWPLPTSAPSDCRDWNSGTAAVTHQPILCFIPVIWQIWWQRVQ